MAKIIRPTYPKEVSIGLLLLVFAVSFFLAPEIFQAHPSDPHQGFNIYLGMFLLSVAVVVMLLVLWEEFLFPIKVNIEAGEVIFRNHRNKLKKQMLIYSIIPFIFVFIYLRYDVNIIRFTVWAAICIIAPVVGKLVSGLKNYNDFLKLTDDYIEYKNNEKEGVFETSKIKQIVLVKDDRKVLHKIQLLLTDNNQVLIDLDEMELEAFIVAIDKFITAHYKGLVK